MTRRIAALACIVALSGAAACTASEATPETSLPPQAVSTAAGEPTTSGPVGTADESTAPIDGAALPENGATVDAEVFAEAMETPGTVILDARTPAEFADGHIEGAVNIDIESGDFGQRLEGLSTDVPYAVYCRSGNRSAVALAQMKKLGFTQTYHLGGGVGAWAQSGRPLVR